MRKAKRKMMDSSRRSSMMSSEMKYLRSRWRHICVHSRSSMGMAKRMAKKAKAMRKAATTGMERKAPKRDKNISENNYLFITIMFKSTVIDLTVSHYLY